MLPNVPNHMMSMQNNGPQIIVKEESQVLSFDIKRLKKKRAKVFYREISDADHTL